MELIKGKWYKNLGERKDHTGKFSGWYDPETISVSEYIYKDKLRGASERFTKAYKFAKECPLSEIQQYLPDGHPDKEFVLPEKWAVRCSEDTYNIIDEWFFDKTGSHRFDAKKNSYWMYPVASCNVVTTDCIYRSYTEVTFEQFKKYVLKTKGMEEKEIVGYKLKEDCEKYREAATILAPYRSKYFNGEADYLIYPAPDGHACTVSVLRKAGVLDLWFEPVFKEKFKIGDWVTGGRDVTGRIVKHCKSFADSWSLDAKGDLEKYNSCSESGLRLATSEEIKKTLVEEAIKRGFKGGVKIDKTSLNYVGHTMFWTLSSSSSGFTYEPSRDELQWSASQDIVYRNGKWAEILPSYPQIEINGYKGEFFDDYVKFGCAEIDKDVFIRLGQLGQGLNRCNRVLESVTIGKGTFSKDQIKLIADYYLNKK